MKERSQVYIPILDDDIDIKVGEFINESNDPGKLTKLFLREGNGVYSFGTKRIYVKQENGKVFIRVGGGYLSIEEFIRQNVGVELEKMAIRDPVNILANNAAINKMTSGRTFHAPYEKGAYISTQSYKNALNATDIVNKI